MATSLLRFPIVRLPHRGSAFRGLSCASLLFLAGCSSESGAEKSGQKGEGTSSFVSHVPGQSGSGESGAATGGSDSADFAADDGDSAERAIAEADMIQVDGDRLYALSRYSGLSIINIQDPSNLRLLGNYRSSATPFEMYLEGGTAYVMYNAWSSYEFDEETGSYQWTSSSRMQALDVSSPEDIRLIGEKVVPGEIADSRKVGDVVYLATHEDGWCWRCEDVANTQVTSFNVSDPQEFSPVDSVVFQSEDAGWRRSISVTSERIYVSGWSWSGGANQGGTIDVVDISDPGGELVKGTTIDVAGQIQSRWQMDEYDGTLRVISQPGGWGTTTPPVVETFAVTSATEVSPVASLDMVLPRPEELKSVRFDGERAFAITFERTDPLFTFDLSDPSNPQQIGELEIPGWVYHMEPRGDRIYALGFDDGVDSGALHVSLFDVSDLANPTMIERVNFGGDWGSFAEDQDRIHKAFNILEDEGLILVPFSGSSYENSCSYEFQSGIQLVDFTADTLALRGVAPQVGSARRALLHKDALFGITDSAVQTFDISDRDAPAELDQLDTARNISSLRVMGNTVLRFGQDWWTDQTVLDFTRLDDAQAFEPIGELDLSAIVGGSANECSVEPGEYFYQSENWGGQVFVHGSYAYVPRYRSVNRESANGWQSSNALSLYIVDINNRAKPEIVGKLDLDPTEQDGGKDYSYYAGIVQTESALLVGRSSGTYNFDPDTGHSAEASFSYDVIDLFNPLDPQVVERFEVPSLLAKGGWGYGASGCSVDMGWGWWGGYGGYGYYGEYGSSQNALVSGDIVVSQHEEPLDDGTGRVRYYLDRIDVSEPSNPKLLASINIPGTVVHFEAETGRLLTLDYVLDETPANDWGDCQDENESFYGYFDEESRTCRTYRRRLNVLDLNGSSAVLRDRHEVDTSLQAMNIAVTADKVFYKTARWLPDSPVEKKVHVLSHDEAGDINVVDVIELEHSPQWWGQMVARGDRAFLTESNEMTVIDASSDSVKVTRHEMPGWSCSALEVSGDVAYCAMGQYGVKTFPLD